MKLNVISPLAIRSDHAPGGSETAKFISGSTLLGALDSTHRLLCNKQTDEFESLFLTDNIHYPHLYPANFKDQDVENSDNWPVYPVPRTAQTCKRFPGFSYIFPRERKVEPGDRHGVRDSLFDWVLFEMGSGGMGNRNANISSLGILRAYKECESAIPEASGQLCRSAMDVFNGYYRREPYEDGHMISASSEKTRLQTHTGISREWGIVEESILYSREVLEEGAFFWGLAKVPDELAEMFEKYIENVGLKELVRIGTGRTRGLGKVTLGIGEIEDETERLESFEQRLKNFNDAFHVEAEKHKVAVPKSFYFALTLHSPAILQDKCLRYRGSIDPIALAELTGLPSDPFTLVYQSAGMRRVTGWNELWGTPKTNEYAIETGSVFFFSSDPPLDKPLLEALFRLEEGIGRRRAEGLGCVSISDPFHVMKGELQ